MTEKLKNNIIKNIEDAISTGVSVDNLCFRYIRVSSNDQAENGNSLTEQEFRSSSYIESNNLHVVHTFSCSESAYKEGRIIFNQMLTLALELKVINIVFKNYDRLSRNHLDWSKVLNHLKTGALSIHFYEQGVVLHEGSTAEEFLMGDIQLSMAKFWSNKISQGVKSANHYRVTVEKLPIQYPDGYIYDKEGRFMRIDKDREPTIRRIFELFDEGQSQENIVEIIKHEGYMTNGKRGKPKPFSKSTIDRLLKMPFYYGYFKNIYEDNRLEKGKIEPYFPFEMYQERLLASKSRRAPNRGQGQQHLLSNFVHCIECQRMLTGFAKTDKGQYTYIKYSHNCSVDKRKKTYSEQPLLKLIHATMKDYIYNEEQTEILKQRLKNLTENQTGSVNKERLRFIDEINKLTKKRKNLTDLYAEGFIPKEELKTVILQINEDIEILNGRITDVTEDISDYHDDVLGVIDYLRQFPELYQSEKLTDEEKIEYIKCIVDRVYYDGETVRFEFKKPFSDLLIVAETMNKIAPANFRRGLSWVDDGA